MTEREAKILCKLIDFEEIDFNIDTSDSETLKAVTHNRALGRAKQIIRDLQKGRIDLDVLKEL